MQQVEMEVEVIIRARPAFEEGLKARENAENKQLILFKT